MSTTIYRAIPDHPDVSITHLNESLQFIGNDVESITIDNIQYGCTFTLDEFEEHPCSYNRYFRHE